MLGKTGLRVSTIGFGGSALGAEFGPIDDRQSQDVVDWALELGINYFDTSPYYGRQLAEKRLGAALQGKRAAVVLATKCGRYDTDGFDFSRKRILASIDESLQRLRTDRVDVLQAHDIEFGRAEQVFGETYEALEHVKRQGKARFIGMTGYPLGMLRQAVERCELDVVLSYCRYALYDTALETELAPLARSKGVGLINASPIGMGLLSGHDLPAWHPAPAALGAACRHAAEHCRQAGADLAMLAMQFALACPLVDTTVVGTRSVDKLRRNVQALEVPIDRQLLKDVQAILAPVKNTAWPSGRPENNPSDLSPGDTDHA